jgi:hypothetical protein
MSNPYDPKYLLNPDDFKYDPNFDFGDSESDSIFDLSEDEHDNFPRRYKPIRNGEPVRIPENFFFHEPLNIKDFQDQTLPMNIQSIRMKILDKTRNQRIGLFIVFLTVVGLLIWWITILTKSKDDPHKSCTGKLDPFQLVQKLEYPTVLEKFGSALYAPKDARYLVTPNGSGEFVGFRMSDNGLYDVVHVDKLQVPTTSKNGVVVSGNMGMTDSGRHKVFVASRLNVVEVVVFESNPLSSESSSIFGRHLGSSQYVPSVIHASNLVPGHIQFDPLHKDVFGLMVLPGPDTICQIGAAYHGEFLTFQIQKTTVTLKSSATLTPRDPTNFFTGHFHMTSNSLFLTVSKTVNVSSKLDFEGAGVEYHVRSSDGNNWVYQQTVHPTSATDSNMVHPASGFGCSMSTTVNRLFVTSLTDLKSGSISKPGVILEYYLESKSGLYQYRTNIHRTIPKNLEYFGVGQKVIEDRYVFVPFHGGVSVYDIPTIDTPLTFNSVIPVNTPEVTTSSPSIVASFEGLKDVYLRFIGARPTSKTTLSSIQYYSTTCKRE